MAASSFSTISAPPPPPIPRLERPLSPNELADALRAFHSSYYVEHPFHQLMHDGRLTQRQRTVLLLVDGRRINTCLSLAVMHEGDE